MSYASLEEVINDPMFARADLELRRGRHLGNDGDAFLYEYITTARAYLERFYAAYGVRLMCGQEGYFYLLPERSVTPAPLGSRKLSAMEMLVGQAIAMMRLDPKWLATNGRIPDKAVLAVLEHTLGEEKLLRYAGRKRGRDNEIDSKKLREKLTASLGTLDRLGFITREGRGKSELLPLISIMRFADPVRTSDSLEEALARLIAEGVMEESSEDTVDEDNGGEDANGSEE